MKKFLTMLLALSVVFTYTVGTAFAVTPADDTLKTADQVRTEIKAEYEAAVKAIDNAKAKELGEKYRGSAKYADISGVSVEKTIATKVLGEKYFDTLKSNADKKYFGFVNTIEAAIAHKDFVAFTTATEDGSAYPKYDATLYNFSKYDTTAGVDWSEAEFVKALAVAQAKAVKENAEKHIAAIDLSVYSKEVATGKTESNYDVASKLISKAMSEVGNVAIPTDLDSAKVTIAAVNEVYTPAVGLANPTGKLYVGGAGYAPGLNNITKIADQGKVDADLDYAKEKVLSRVLGKLSNDKNIVIDGYQVAIRVENGKAKPSATIIKGYNDDIAAVKEAYDAAVETYTYLIKNCNSIDNLGKFVNNKFEADNKWVYNTTIVEATDSTKTLANFKTINVDATPYDTAYVAGVSVAETLKTVQLISDAKEAAEIAKVSVDLDGDMMIKIDEALKSTIESIYTTGKGVFVAPTKYTEVAARQDALIGSATKLSVEVAGKSYGTVYKIKSYADGVTYDSAKFDEIRALAAETKAAIKAAKTVAEAEAAFLAGYAKFDAIPTANEHNAMFTTLTGALKTKYEEYITNLTKLATGIEAVEIGNPGTKYSYLETGDLKTDFVNTIKADMKAECFTLAELEAKYNEAAATLNGLKTTEQLKAEKVALEKQIVELPKVVVLADKAAVNKVADAVSDYNDYIKLVGADSAVELVIDATYKSALDSKATRIQDLDKEAIKDAYDKLNSKYVAGGITLADKEAIEALRATVDAYVNEYKDDNATNTAIEALETGLGLLKFAEIEEKMTTLAVDEVELLIAKLPVDVINVSAINAARKAFDALPDGAVIDQKYYDKLVALEKLADEKLVKGVLATTIKLSSKATKSGITLNIKKSAGYKVDYYKVYRSTKLNSGFKFIYKTKNTTTLNKSVKDGVKYYYKVVGVRKVGDKYYRTEYSNKAIRTAK